MNPFSLASQQSKRKLNLFKKEGNGTENSTIRSAFCECPVCGNLVLESNINIHLDTECMKNKNSPQKSPSTKNSLPQTSPKTTNPMENPRRTNQTVNSSVIDLSGEFKSNSSSPISSLKEENPNHESNQSFLHQLNAKRLSVKESRKPLAERMRPKTFEDLFGNTELIGSRSLLRRLLSKDPPPSVILYGPPGCGKTSIAHIIHMQTQCTFKQLSATNSGVNDIKELFDVASNEYRLTGKSTILFLDEIHRFNKRQQDVLLPYIECGIIILIGATTEMPSFCLNNALLSRCQVISLNKLQSQDVHSLINRALTTDPILLSKQFHLSEDVKSYISIYCDGDGRKALNIVDMCVQDQNDPSQEITLDYVKELCANKFNYYDRDGEDHYNCISAYIKSIRGSDVQGALYWLVRMIEGGEDPIYICRRMIISSSEDIGLADPMALIYSNNCFQAVQTIGMPECVYALVQNTIYLALTSKSNECYLALNRARDVIQSNPLPPVPLHLRNSSTELQEKMGYGVGYQYGYNKNQTYLPHGYEEYTFVDVYRAMRDLRLPSLRRYMNEHQKPSEASSSISMKRNQNPSEFINQEQEKRVKTQE